MNDSVDTNIAVLSKVTLSLPGIKILQIRYQQAMYDNWVSEQIIPTGGTLEHNNSWLVLGTKFMFLF